MAHVEDVVIVGAGIVGSSIAYHLAAAGCRNVLMIEREKHQGKGSTGKSMGGVRAQFATAVTGCLMTACAWIQVAGAEGIEPPTFGFGDRRSAN